VDTIDPTIAQRWTALGLTRPGLSLALRATITARTLVAPQSPEEGRAAAPSVPEQLPRIPLADCANLPRAPRDPSGPDLCLIRLLGEGGMGRVYLAHQRSLDREVAIKTLKTGGARDLMSALLDEGRLTGALEHPGVIPVHALGLDDTGQPFLVMKRVEGVDWQTLLQDASHPIWSSRLAPTSDRLAENLRILAQVCQTLEFAHSRGVTHRDIKPENVMVGRFGEVLLADWGIATRTTDPPSSLVLGTPVYMAPEMARGEPVDARTDVYLLGATLHEMLTGRCRHEGGTLVQVLRSALLSTPIAYDETVPAQLADLCNRATARDPDDRPQTAQAFREELLDFLRHKSALALSDAASVRLDALRALLADVHEDAPPKDLSTAYRLATEARFGFTHCLLEHAGSVAAQRGMRDSIAAQIDLELRQSHTETARALLQELAEPDAPLAARVARSEELAVARAREAERLRAMAHDLDASISRTTRSVLIAALAVAVAFGSVLIIVGIGGQLTNRWALDIHLGVMAIAGAVLFSFRRALLANRFNRRLVALVFAVLAAQLVNRALATMVGTAIPELFSRDLLMLAGVTGAAAVALHGRLAWAAVPPLVGLVAVQLDPGHAIIVFATATFSCTIIAALAVWRGTARETTTGE
jgi:eukaryotic-like serine/threonine-protein kinase